MTLGHASLIILLRSEFFLVPVYTFSCELPLLLVPHTSIVFGSICCERMMLLIFLHWMVPLQFICKGYLGDVFPSRAIKVVGKIQFLDSVQGHLLCILEEMTSILVLVLIWICWHYVLWLYSFHVEKQIQYSESGTGTTFTPAISPLFIYNYLSSSGIPVLGSSMITCSL